MPLSSAEIDFLRDLISKRSGNVVSNAQGYLLDSRLGPLATSEKLDSVSALVAKLRSNPSSLLADRVAEAMTINETSFFRDMQPFDALRQDIIPQLMKSREQKKQIDIWCAASSSGQEPYSIAILLREHFPNLATWRVRITATDLSDEMLARTKNGVYSQFEVNRGLPARMLVKHFDRNGANWKVKDDIRQMIDCKKLNLASAWPIVNRFDVIFMRNVLIYFDSPTKEGILNRSFRALQPDGYLMLGGGETMINLNVPFSREAVGSTVCFRPLLKQELAHAH